MKKMRVALAVLFAFSTLLLVPPAAMAEECEDWEPSCQPCGDKINAITQKLYGDDLITCPW